MLNVTFFSQISFRNSDRAGYSDLNPVDRGQSLYPMGTVLLECSFASNIEKNAVGGLGPQY